MQKYAVPSGMVESCVRIRPGVRNAAWTSHRGHDPEKRAKLLRDWDLAEHSAFQDGGSIEQMNQAVAEESGTKQVETWIGVDSVEPNPEYDPEA